MRYIFLVFTCALLVTGCGSSKRASSSGNRVRYSQGKSDSRNNGPIRDSGPQRSINQNLVIDGILNTALGYLGTRYKYGGTTKNGMDCSGLIYTAYLSQNISLQRTSYMMAEQGSTISMNNIAPGDLVFFITNSGSRINHVGLVVEATGSEVKFIHATTSAGVIISSLDESYWSRAFKFARRMKI